MNINTEHLINIQKTFCENLANNFNFQVDIKMIQLDLKKALLIAKNVNLNQLYETLLNNKLLYKNLHRNENIYFAPSRTLNELDMAFIDDPNLDEQNKLIFKKLSFAIIHTSTHKTQVIFKLDNKYDIKTVFKIQQYLAKHFQADRAATSVFQYRRMPGFLNHKYNPPFEINAHYYYNTLKAQVILEEIKASYKYKQDKTHNNNENYFKKFKNYNWQFFYNFKTINHDESRADFLYTLYLLKRNFTDEEIKHLLLSESVNIRKRKAGHLHDYINRTIQNARQYLANHAPHKFSR